jgi:hypothetical protein
VHAHGLPGYEKTETGPRAISPASLAESLEQLCFAFWNSAALVLNLDDKALAFGMRAEDHRAARPRVLECIVQQVHHRRREQLRVGLDGQREPFLRTPAIWKYAPLTVSMSCS